ncbi:MAG: Cytochrome c biogenesis protein transmembrane region [candidate division CPR1 bacterium GW2011_GWC1_49_13]|uniref:Cytochrome c biogenesis protein transmembrane region n=1 Tax=candidate division CPR1 bacterium GW2011_GWC1_49_13 TaxID=1618342 RepID=A0A0G1VFU4_9BACT|nr:MAG: Cytochrome c biogenesis protein transmembrane region [candidate division CPR1 bacterium GW2011_GWC1_49_13]
MTLVFALGIFVVMLPAVLGIKAISLFVFRYHQPIYVAGGFLMVLAGILALLGVKIPMLSLKTPNVEERPDVPTVFLLGIVSGITSACCAPVLAGVLALSFISPTVWLAVAVGAFYVLGMVTPLFFMSYFLDKKQLLSGKFFKKSLGEFSIFGKSYPILMGNLISFAIFFLMGLLVIYLTLATDFSMAAASGFMQNIVYSLKNSLEAIPYLDTALAVLILGGFGYLLWRGLSVDKKN